MDKSNLRTVTTIFFQNGSIWHDLLIYETEKNYIS
jgi:hypothetical protein